MPGPDHSASIEPYELSDMMQAIANTETLLGDGTKQVRPIEEEARRLVRRGLKAARAMPAGEVLSLSDIAILRPATGLSPEYYKSLVGRRLSKAVAPGDPLDYSHFE